MDPHTGRLPSTLWLGEQQIAKLAAAQPFLERGLADVELPEIERRVALACGRGDVVERAVLYRVITRQNGRLNGQGEAWLSRLAASIDE